MNDDLFCYLDSYQVLGLLQKIEELQEKTPGFNDTVADSFKKQAIEQSAEILKTPNILLKLFPKKATYKFSKSMIYYLNCITETDVFDENNMDEYIKITNKLEEEKEKKKILKNTKND